MPPPIGKQGKEKPQEPGAWGETGAGRTVHSTTGRAFFILGREDSMVHPPKATPWELPRGLPGTPHWPILTLDLGRAVDGGRPGEELDGQRGLDAPHQRDGDARPLHRHHPRHRRHPAPVLEDPKGKGREGQAGGAGQPCARCPSPGPAAFSGSGPADTTPQPGPGPGARPPRRAPGLRPHLS